MKFIEAEKVLAVIDENIFLWKSNAKNKNISDIQYGAVISALISVKCDIEHLLPANKLIQVK